MSALETKESLSSSSGKPTHEHVEHVRGLDAINEFDEEVIIAEGKEKINGFTWYLIFIAALSGLLFGYDTGVISAALVNINQDLTPGRFLTNLEKEWVSGSTSCGAFIGAIGGGVAMDRWGRKLVLVAGDVFFCLGALLIATGFGIIQVIIGRVVLGFGVGIAAGVCAVYLSELAPTRHRGLIVGLQSLAITGGQMISFAIGAGMTFRHGWRVLFAISIPPAVFQAIALHWLPESPRYDLMKGNREAARSTLQRIYGTSSEAIIERKIEIISATVAIGAAFKERYPSFPSRMRAIATTGSYRRPIMVSALLFLACQLGGVNSLMYYSSTLFAAAGLKNPTAVAVVAPATNFVATTLGVVFLDRVGRRRMFLCTLPLATVAIFMASMSFYFLAKPTGGRLDTENLGKNEGIYDPKWVNSMLVMIVLYLIGFAPSVGTVPYTTIELMPLEVRAIGTSIAVGFQWGGNILMATTFLSLMNAIGPAANFGIYGAILAITFIFAYFCYPEPSGLSIEETAELFIDGFGVKKARAMHQARLAVQKEANYADQKA